MIAPANCLFDYNMKLSNNLRSYWTLNTKQRYNLKIKKIQLLFDKQFVYGHEYASTI